MNKRLTSDLWWTGMHFLLALAVPFLLVALVSCNKAKEEKEDLGPEFTGDQIDLALSKAINDANLDKLSVGQFSEYVTTQRVETEENTMAVSGSRVEVIKREETDTTVKFTLKIVRTDRQSNGSWETRVTEEPLTLNKAAPLPPSEASESQLSASSLATSATGSAAKRVTFHKLRESTGTIDAPPRVRTRSGCGGLSPCEIPVRYISFDMVQWTSDKDYQKISLDFAFSLQTPFLPFGQDFEQLNGLLILDCRATYIPVEKRRVYVRECKSLEDFQK